MWRFSVDCGEESVVGTWINQSVQQWKGSFLVWFLYGELHMWVLGVDVM